MKKIILFILVLALVPLVNSAIELNKDSYNVGDTVLAKLSFVYPPNEIKYEHINIFDSENRKVSIPYYIVKFTDSRYYLYFTIPESMRDDNYTISVGPYFYALNGLLQMKTDTTLLKNNIRDGDTISINPAAINIDYSNQNYFNLELKNNGLNPLNLKLKIINGTLNYNEYKLQSGDFLKINAKVDSPGERVLQIFYNDIEFLVPVLVIAKAEVPPTAVQENIRPQNALKFIEDLSQINVSVKKDKIVYGTVRFKNVWTSEIHDVKVELSGNLNQIIILNTTTFNSVKADSIEEINMIINPNKNIDKNYNGEIKLTAQGVSAAYPVYIYYKPLVNEEIPEELPPKETVTEQQVIQKQSELNKGYFFSLAIVVIILLLLIWIILKTRKKSKVLTFSNHR
ncbi:MAG: hypothetical protein PHF86_06030 [Candidatus Nanoarchaeia archaeon]|nr:hypothetical protein [Candidatus Nanoarchaeia archaeon]